MLSLLFLCSAVADALKFDGGISLSQLPTPALLVDVDELPGGVEALPHAPRERREALRDALFIHARVVAAGKERAGFYKGRGAPLAELDVELAGDAYLATGLNNNWSYDNSYFWARTLGSGARRPAPGIGLDAIGDRTAVRWLRDDEPGAPQTGDGKFSEWAEFLDVGDEGGTSRRRSGSTSTYCLPRDQRAATARRGPARPSRAVGIQAVTWRVSMAFFFSSASLVIFLEASSTNSSIALFFARTSSSETPPLAFFSRSCASLL